MTICMSIDQKEIDLCLRRQGGEVSGYRRVPESKATLMRGTIVNRLEQDMGYITTLRSKYQTIKWIDEHRGVPPIDYFVFGCIFSLKYNRYMNIETFELIKQEAEEYRAAYLSDKMFWRDRHSPKPGKSRKKLYVRPVATIMCHMIREQYGPGYDLGQAYG